jgi:hypothetical protein
VPVSVSVGMKKGAIVDATPRLKLSSNHRSQMLTLALALTLLQICEICG